MYGSIVSTAEKARDGAKRALGSWQPSVKQGKENLLAALKVQQDWEARATKAKELLKNMLQNRKETAEQEKESSGGQHTADANEELGDEQILKVLMREELLTRAKLHVLQYERMMGDLQLRSLRAELVQVLSMSTELSPSPSPIGHKSHSSFNMARQLCFQP